MSSGNGKISLCGLAFPTWTSTHSFVPLTCPALIHMFTARVYYNPNIDDHTLWRPRCDIFEEEQGRLRVEFEMPGVPR